MDKLWQLMDETPMGGGPFHPETILLSLLLAFVLGQVLAWVYYITHSGLSYSRSYVQSIILITVVVSMVMAVCPLSPGASTVISLPAKPPIRKIMALATVVVTAGLSGVPDFPPPFAVASMVEVVWWPVKRIIQA